MMCCNRCLRSSTLSLPALAALVLLPTIALLGTSIYSPFALSGREVRRAVLKVGLI